jgi:hypothetical protein
MNSSFYDLYNSYNQQELFEVLLHPEDYQREAIDCATQILVEKKWADEYDKVCEEKKTEQEKQTEEEEANNLKMAEYYRKAVDIKMQHNGYKVLLADTEKFEERLAALNIDYFKEDPTLSRQAFNPDFHYYYFKAEDVVAVDAIGKELGIFSNAYENTKAQDRAQWKFLAVILIGFAVVCGLYLLFKK